MSMAHVAAPEQQEMLRWWGKIMDALPFYVMLVDDRHRILAWNQALRREIGDRDPVGAYCPELIHGTADPYPGCPLEQSVGTASPVETELFDEATGRWMSSAVYPTGLVTQEGRGIYLHFTRNVTEQKLAATALAQSLEHHKAIGVLLQRLRDCQSPEQTLSELVDTTLSLSWMSNTSGAGAFLAKGDELALVVCRHLAPEVMERCARVPLGECLCGTTALELRPFSARAGECRHLRVSRSEDRQGTHGHATLPLVHEGRALGVVNFYLRFGATELTSSQMSFLEAATAVTAAALGSQLARQRAHEAQTRASQLERQLLEGVIASQEDERKRVARELHDDLGQGLSALLLELKTAAHAGGVHGEICDRMEQSVRDLIGRIYQLAWDLRPSILDDYGLDSALTRHVNILSKRTGLSIDYRFVCPEGSLPRLPNTLEVLLYRVTQEALANVVRHAEATRVSVVVLRQSDKVTVIVEDDGRGFDPSSVAVSADGRGLGILGMRERVTLANGEMTIDSGAGQGTSLRVKVPLVET